MTFACPWAFALFLPLAAAAWRMLRRGRRGGAIQLPGAGRLARRPSWRQRTALVPPALFLAGLAAGIVALARPQRVSEIRRASRDAVAIEMAVDVSGSMRALDLSPREGPAKTRLDVVKETFAAFAKRRPDDLLGLVVFGGYPSTRSPLTFDHDALLELLDAVEIPGDDGRRPERAEVLTAIGDGLAMACARLAPATNVASRVAILLSDGVQNYGDNTPEAATALARQQGVKVYAIGVGTAGGMAPVARPGRGVREPELDVFGRVARIPSEFDEAALRRIAEGTGGRYYNVRTDGMLEEALAEIDALEKTAVEQEKTVRREELFRPWLAASFALACLGLAAAGASRRSLV